MYELSKLRTYLHMLDKDKNHYNKLKIEEIKILLSKLEIYLSYDEKAWAKNLLYDDSNLVREWYPKNTFTQRRSIRKYSHGITNQDFQHILNNVNYAPSSCNRQPIEFILLRDSIIIDKIAKIKKQSFISGAETCILVISDLSIYPPKSVKSRSASFWYFLYMDAGASIQTLLLTISKLNFGACWVNCIESDSNKIKQIKKLELELAKNKIVTAIIPVGVPSEIVKTPGRKDAKYKIIG